MSNADNTAFPGFGKFVPGFDFLQNLAKQAAGSAPNIPQLPPLGNWVGMTMNVEELDKRIEELKAVQFWLDQNAMALKATIQALEVQKMTLATLKGMNFNMGDVANAFKLKVADSLAGGAQKVADKARSFSGLEVPSPAFQADKPAAQAPTASDQAAEKPSGKSSANARAKSTTESPAASGVLDPLQWWGALTQQFQAIATDAMKEAAKKAAVDTTKTLAAGLAKEAVKTATDMARGMAESASKTVASGARAAMNTALGSRSAQPKAKASGLSSASSPAPSTAKTPVKTSSPSRKAQAPASAPAAKTKRRTAR